MVNDKSKNTMKGNSAPVATYPQVKKLSLIGAPNRIVEGIFVRNQSEALESIIWVKMGPLTSLAVAVTLAAINTFGDALREDIVSL